VRPISIHLAESSTFELFAIVSSLHKDLCRFLRHRPHHTCLARLLLWGRDSRLMHIHLITPKSTIFCTDKDEFTCCEPYNLQNGIRQSLPGRTHPTETSALHCPPLTAHCLSSTYVHPIRRAPPPANRSCTWGCCARRNASLHRGPGSRIGYNRLYNEIDISVINLSHRNLCTVAYSWPARYTTS